MRPYIFDSERLKFSAWGKEDLPLAMELWGNPHVTQFISIDGFSEADVGKRLFLEMANMCLYGLCYWPVFLKKGGAFIGCGGLRPYILEERVYELGVHLLPAYWGHGYGAEAGLSVIDYAKHTIGAAALFAGHHPENKASQRLLMRLGFEYEEDVFYGPTGRKHPSYRLGL